MSGQEIPPRKNSTKNGIKNQRETDGIYIVENEKWEIHMCLQEIKDEIIDAGKESVDIVNIGLHFFLKDVRPMLPPVMNRSIVDA